MYICTSFLGRAGFVLSIWGGLFQVPLSYIKKSNMNNLETLLKEKGKDRNDLSKLLWKKSSPGTRAVNMSRLLNGKKKTIKPGWVGIICSFLGVDANELFTIKDKKNES